MKITGVNQQQTNPAFGFFAKVKSSPLEVLSAVQGLGISGIKVKQLGPNTGIKCKCPADMTNKTLAQKLAVIFGETNVTSKAFGKVA